MVACDYTHDDDCAWTDYTTTDCTFATRVWRTWTTATTCDTTSTCSGGVSTRSSTVWAVWASSGTSDRQWKRVSSPAYKPRELTAEEKVAAARAEEERKERLRLEAERLAAEEAKRKAEEEVADKRAEELLVAALDAEQKAEYAKDKTFCVRTRTGRRYRIRRAWSGHVARLGDCGREVERLCAHPSNRVPLPDNMLIAKLMLDTDEDRFRKVANISPLVPAGAN